MNFKVKPRIALILMLFVGGLVIYIGSSIGFQPIITTEPVDRCSQENANLLSNRYLSTLNQVNTPVAEDKTILLRLVNDFSEVSDCQNVISQTITLAKRLVSFELTLSEQLNMVYALLHGLENAKGGFQASDTEHQEATVLAEYFLQSINQEALAKSPELMQRFQDLTQMIAIAFEPNNPKRAEFWKTQNPKHAPTATGVTNTKPPNRRDAK